MGVHGLWELLAPVGRRVSVETLAGKKLAIDASIWMVQFMKAMRDERGEMVRNAHLLGFFRRICKLLYLRTKPVFVFDGGTPALKRRTVIARRRQRENAQAKVRKTAEKLLLNHLKAMKLKEIAEDIKNQRQKQKNDVKGKKVSLDQANLAGSVLGQIDTSSNTYNQEKLDEMLAASIMAEEGGSLANNSIMSSTIPYEEDSDENEEMILPDMHGAVDPAVLAALTPSLQHDILVQKQRQDSDAKGKKTLLDKMVSNLERDAIASSCNQEKLDEMLAASLMEEESRSLSNNASTSTAPYAEDGDMDEDEDEDEEMILPAMDDGVDPSILASLPPSMQLDLLVQNRERLMAENRQKYQKVKKDPGKFSELQIQAYLKTVAFRREIDQVQKAASGRGVGGVQTSRIASEAGREFIFSSSFTGDKQVLTSGRAEKSGDKQQATEERHSSVMHAAASTSKSNTAIGSKPNESRRVFDENIETYLDERGRVRVSRVRAMGIRMTRDLQRNLDLMKEVEQERENANGLIHESNRAVPANFSAKKAAVTSHDGAESVQLNDVNQDSVLKNGASIEISFEDDGDLKCFNGDDDIFARLVAENPLKLSSDKITPEKVSSGSDSDCDWEEGTTETKDRGFSDDVNLKPKHAYAEDNNSNDSEVEWEEGDCDITQHTVPPRAESGTFNSKGDLEERADLQEAIRRSLEDLEDQKSSCVLLNDDKFEVPGGNASETSRSLDPEDTGLNFAGDDGNQQNRSTGDILGDVQMLDGAGVPSISKITDSPGRPLKSSVACNSDNSRVLVDTPHQIDMDSPPDQPMKDASEMANSSKEAPYKESVTPSKAMEVNVAPNFSWIDNQKTSADAEPPCPLVEDTNPVSPLSEAVTNELIRDIENEENLAAKKIHEECFQEIEDSLENSAVKDNEDLHIDVTEANLEEEINILGQERMDLGAEQRRLERNAESVSSEMFTECQELLQMFGLPYIIAPMEAEAQCAYMELASLVDGVVTDDSDVFLFGGRSVYKNIFDDRKYVETYFMKDIENELGLTREKLIRMALLLGSDYTEGISGIGIVNAIEVVHAFPEEDGLKKFREWIESPDPTILGNFSAQTDSSARKKGSNTGDNENSSQGNLEDGSSSHENNSEVQEQTWSADHIRDITKVFMDKHRKVSKNWHIPLSFPSEAVISAYIRPQVDKSTEPFTWGKPDHFVLRKLCWEKFGWGSQKADELVVPVLKEYNKHETQLRLEAFYTFNERFAKIRSKRINKALKGITGNKSLQLTDDAAQEVSRKNKKKSKPQESEDDQLEKLPQGTEESVIRNRSNNGKKSTPKQSRKRKTPTVEVASESLTSSDDKQGTGRRSRVNGRGRGRGRGRARTAGRGKGKESAAYSVSEMSSSDDDDVQEVHMEKQEEPPEFRRSTRVRKTVDYTGNDSEMDDLDKSVEQGDKKSFDGEPSQPDITWIQDQSETMVSGLSQEKEQSTQKISPGDGLDEDCLDNGGGFCPDDGDNDQPNASQRNDPYLEGEFSDEYLKIGGGFCVDEGENENSISGQATAAIVENDDLSHCSGLERKDAYVSEPTTDQLDAMMNDDQTKSDTSPGNTQRIPVGGLCAMPLLRKKRRKS